MKKILLLVVLITTFVRAQSISNSGFEANSSYSIFSKPDSFGGWTVNSGTVGLPLSSLGNPRSGVQVLVPDFTASAASASLSQIISGLSMGDFYRIEFYTSAYATSTYFGTSNASVSIGGVSTSFSYTFDGNTDVRFGSTSAPWIMRSLVFTALSPSDSLIISVTHSTTDPYIGFDDFSIAQIPEPGSFGALLGCTALIISASLRSRTRRYSE
jgi:hypothetical protein